MASLVALKLIVIGIIISMAVNVHNFDQLLFAGATDVHMIFTDTGTGLEKITELVEDHGLIMSRLVAADYENLTLYVTDTSFASYIQLSEGRFPIAGGNEFISNVRQDDDNQVGLIANLTPEFNITIRPMDDVRNLQIDGRYRLHTADVDLLLDIESEMLAYTSLFQISAPMEDNRTFLETIMMGVFVMPTVLMTAIIIAIPIVAFLCVVATLLQFSMSKAKESFTLYVHGFSQYKIILKSLETLLKTMLVSGFIACVILYGYLIISGLLRFHLQIMLIFLLVFSLMILIYLAITAMAMWLIFQLFSSHTAIKGYKPDLAIQILNHALKIIFMSLFLVGSHFVMMSLSTLSTQRTHLQNWEAARDVHRLYLSSFLPIGTDEFVQEIHDLEQLRLELSEAHQGFIMHAENFFAYDTLPQLWENRGEHRPPFEIAPDGNRVDVSFHYFQVNPIYTIEGLPVEDAIIWDDLVLNLLVPVKLMPYETLIQEIYLEEFYFGSVHWRNRDESEESILHQHDTMDDLWVNIIYVANEQYYFTFDTRIRADDGNQIKDPIAVIHTGNFHFMYMMGLMGSGFYYISESDDPLDGISEVIASHDLSYTVRFSFSTFDENVEAMRLVRQDIMSGIFVLFVLMMTNFIVNYNLISNYFWRNKHTLFTKSLFGFSLLKRHKWFSLSFLIYAIPINMIMLVVLGWAAFMMGTIFLVLDVILALVFERRLMKKSFAEIMKGER